MCDVHQNNIFICVELFKLQNPLFLYTLSMERFLTLTEMQKKEKETMRCIFSIVEVYLEKLLLGLDYVFKLSVDKERFITYIYYN